eukprot:m51a1_g7502 hypothetical protein (369) ;mRNA; f:276477-278627
MKTKDPKPGMMVNLLTHAAKRPQRALQLYPDKFEDRMPEDFVYPEAPSSCGVFFTNTQTLKRGPMPNSPSYWRSVCLAPFHWPLAPLNGGVYSNKGSTGSRSTAQRVTLGRLPGPLHARPALGHALYVFVLDALNFCFWPAGDALEYGHLARGLAELLERDGDALAPAALAAATEQTVASWSTPALPDLPERARLVRELGSVLLSRFGGDATRVVDECEGDVSRFVALVAECLPGFRDSCVYRGRQVFLYKRAQILAADLWGSGVAQWRNVQLLTMFPDYRVPQVLHGRGALVYSPDLDARVRARQELCAGSEEEVEIRAATVQAVEALRAMLGGGLTAVEVDWLLWQTGEASLAALPPHHRTRTIFY